MSNLKYNGTELSPNFRVKDGKLKYLVVGTGRCGTVFLAKFLSSLGIPCSHEGVFQHDGLESALARMRGELPVTISHIAKLASCQDESFGRAWFNGRTEEVVAESSYMAAPFIQHPSLEKTAIIHVVREPMAVINSFVEGFRYFRDEALHEDLLKEYHEFIYAHVPLLREGMDVLSRAALYYVEWNEMIERLSSERLYYRHCIEAPLDGLMNFIGVQSVSHYKNLESNHKLGLVFRYHRTNQIPIEPIRERLEVIHKRYYLKLQ